MLIQENIYNSEGFLCKVKDYKTDDFCSFHYSCNKTELI